MVCCFRFLFVYYFYLGWPESLGSLLESLKALHAGGLLTLLAVWCCCLSRGYWWCCHVGGDVLVWVIVCLWYGLLLGLFLYGLLPLTRLLVVLSSDGAVLLLV